MTVAPPVGNYVGRVIVERIACVGGRGDAVRHTWTWMAELPFDIAVEIEMIARARD